MKPVMISRMRRYLFTSLVVLVPAAPAFAAVGDCAADPFAPYSQVFRGEGPAYECTPAAPRQAGAAGPAGPVFLETGPSACRNDPFWGYHKSFGNDGPAYECVAATGAPSGAQGPSGPLMTGPRGVGAAHPTDRYRQVFPGDN